MILNGSHASHRIKSFAHMVHVKTPIVTNCSLVIKGSLNKAQRGKVLCLRAHSKWQSSELNSTDLPMFPFLELLFSF